MEKTIEIQLEELRERIACAIENELEGTYPPIDDIDYAIIRAGERCADIARTTL
jgi:hypothetical protein